MSSKRELPDHQCSLHLSHNEHKNYYDTVAQYTADYDDDDWVSKEEKEKAIATNELWELQWYPDTPVGFYKLAASSLEAVLKASKE